MASWSWIPNVLHIVFALQTALPLALSQSTNATCIGGYSWTFNNRSQSPCLVTAYLMGACEVDGQWTVTALPSTNRTTYQPLRIDQVDLCTCSSVTYSMLSACSLCQGGDIPVFDEWIANCPAAILTNGSYFHVVPGGTAVPNWAYLPISPTGSGSWDAAIAEAYKLAHPDSGAIDASTSSPGPSGTSSGLTPSDTPGGNPQLTKHPNVGAIVGGAVGGGLGFVLLCALAFFLWRHNRRRSLAPSTAYVATSLHAGEYDAATGVLDEKRITLPPAPPVSPPAPGVAVQTPYAMANTAPLRIYNPDDPSTFPDAHQQYNFMNRADKGYNTNNVVVYTPQVSHSV